jgi:hypothetical protein
MIDRARIEQMLAEIPPSVKYASYASFQTDELMLVFRQHLALLGIVEALAANPPVMCDVTDFENPIYKCPLCGASARTTIDIEHTERCETRQARELLDPHHAADGGEGA